MEAKKIALACKAEAIFFFKGSSPCVSDTAEDCILDKSWKESGIRTDLWISVDVVFHFDSARTFTTSRAHNAVDMPIRMTCRDVEVIAYGE